MYIEAVILIYSCGVKKLELPENYNNKFEVSSQGLHARSATRHSCFESQYGHLNTENIGNLRKLSVFANYHLTNFKFVGLLAPAEHQQGYIQRTTRKSRTSSC